MKRRVLSLMLTIAMLMAFAPTLPASAAASINIGDYVQMGTYYDAPILWRCVDIDDNGPLMLSDNIICLKAFDAKGEANITTRSHSRYTVRQSQGSVYWADSNIRSWLNSDACAGNVTWLCGNPPDAEHVWNGNSAYDQEAGFLTNFSQSELNAIAEVTQKSIVARSEYNSGIYTSGTEPFKYDNDIAYVVQNYDSAYAESITDKMFLLDVKQVNAVYNNRAILGDEYYIGQLTAECVANNDWASDYLTVDKDCDYWLRTPVFDSGHESPCDVRYVGHDGGGWYGGVYRNSAYDSSGVRPAFYLNTESAGFASGSGTETDPYIVGDNTIKVVLNGTELTFDQPPIMLNDRILVPIRKIAECMGKSVMWSQETQTAFIDNSDTGLIIPLNEMQMYIADENGFSQWEKVSLDVPAMVLNDRTLVPIRAFCESLGADVTWADDENTAYITYDDTAEQEQMRDALFDTICLAYYAEKISENPFTDYSTSIDDFYQNRPEFWDAVAMGASDPFAGITEYIKGISNAEDVINMSLSEIISEIPGSSEDDFDAGILKTIKSLASTGVSIYSDAGGLSDAITEGNKTLKSFNDRLLNYSKNYHGMVSGILDLGVFTGEQLAYILTDYERNVEYIDAFEAGLKDSDLLTDATEAAIESLRTEYTEKFIGVVSDLGDAVIEHGTDKAVELIIGSGSGTGVGLGKFVWDGVLTATRVNKKGENLKIFYGSYCVDGALNLTLSSKMNSKPKTSYELMQLKNLWDMTKAEKITVYKAMKNITNDSDSKEYCDDCVAKLENISYRLFQ